jgi:hypothetical protein
MSTAMESLLTCATCAFPRTWGGVSGENELTALSIDLSSRIGERLPANPIGRAATPAGGGAKLKELENDGTL